MANYIPTSSSLFTF